MRFDENADLDTSQIDDLRGVGAAVGAAPWVAGSRSAAAASASSG